MVVSVSRPASEVGVAVLRRGGNAVDAAVAVAFALAVTWPQAGNLGGGGFMVVYPGGTREPVVIDYRETAPAAATREMFVKERPVYKLVGTPGTVRGLALAHQRFGKLPWQEVVRPALHLAGEGFAVNQALARSLNRVVQRRRSFRSCNGSTARTAARGAGRRATGWCSRTWRGPCAASPRTAPTPSTPARWPTCWPPR
jgi:gamma-glutamyltranspeptidase/glutathione hydrolase